VIRKAVSSKGGELCVESKLNPANLKILAILIQTIILPQSSSASLKKREESNTSM
jgi:hypothetical protein